MKVSLVVGTRPEIIKMASVVEELRSRRIKHELILAGQHYDWEMSDEFTEELGLSVNLRLNPVPRDASQSVQTAKLLSQVERYLLNSKPSVALVEGDTNTALSAALASAKLGIPVGHVEAGCRSFDLGMPEEINRRVVSECASLNFAPTPNALKNLRRENVPGRSILTGHPIVKTVLRYLPRAESSFHANRLGLARGEYVFATLHRPENVDSPDLLRRIIRAFSKLKRTVVFPVHPRTKKRISSLGLGLNSAKGMIAIEPIPFIDTLGLTRNAAYVVTDSGGLQQEAFLLGTPCITLRRTTEWPETVQAGVNRLVNPLSRGLEDGIALSEEQCGRIKKRFARTGDVFGKPDAPARIVTALNKFRNAAR